MRDVINTELVQAGCRSAARAMGAAMEAGGRWVTRLRERRTLLAAIVAVHLVLVVAGLIAPVAALVAIAAVTALLGAIGVPSKATRHGSSPRTPIPQSSSAPWSSEHAWRAIVEAMTDPALVISSDGHVIQHNPPAADLFPRVRAGLHISQLTRSPEVLDAVERARTSDQAVIAQIAERVPVHRHVSAIITAIRAPTGQSGTTGPAQVLLLTFRDVTEQEKLAQMRADFVANASHELRTPLATVRGLVDTLQGPARDDPPARERFLGLMAEQATRMSRLVDDLLTLSRAEMRLHVPPRGIVDLNHVVVLALRVVEPLAETSGTSLELVPAGAPSPVRGDEEELVQVFQNLIQNAVKYGRVGGRIEVRIEHRPPTPAQVRRISVSVRDDGPGIAPEHLPRLTERFYRVSATESRQKGGTGLGLAIVKYIVNRHRGELTIASSQGQGSTFTVVLDGVRETQPG